MIEKATDEEEIVSKAVGRVIEVARHSNIGYGYLELTFVDGSILRLQNGGGDCCAHVYLTCSDDLQSFTGDKFLGYDVLDGSGHPDAHDNGDGVHEIQFLHVRTSGGTITCESHNEHNGYYGGLFITPGFQDNPSVGYPVE